MSETPIRRIRMDDDLWERVNQQAAENGETASALIRRATIHYLKGQQS